MVTVADIFEKPKIELFLNCPDIKFYNSCREREKQIKNAVRHTFRSFNTHAEILAQQRSQLSKWKKEWMGSCISNLGSYLEELINELDKKKIEEYCELEESMGNKFIPFMPDLVLLMINSYQGAVETDLHWVSDLTLKDSIAISVGDFDFNQLQSYLPGKVVEVEKLVKELQSISYVNTRSNSIHEAITCFKNKHHNASNVLLITIIEGLVRSLGIYLKEKQALSFDPSDKRKYASLENFLKKIPWKKDLSINEIQHGLLTGKLSISSSQKKDCNLINLTDRLGFLCRRFKENRNSILHGEETNYGNTLNSFLNLSALKEVLLTIREYNQLYN
jgi:hypothetical protein